MSGRKLEVDPRDGFPTVEECDRGLEELVAAGLLRKVGDGYVCVPENELTPEQKEMLNQMKKDSQTDKTQQE
jgi:hypothetical protein